MKKVLSVKEMQKELGIGRNVAYELVRIPGFPVIRVGKKYLIPRDGLYRWLEENQGKEITK